MTAPKLQNYPTRQNRHTFNQNPNTGLVASWAPGKGWETAGFNLPIPSELSEVVQKLDNPSFEMRSSVVTSVKQLNLSEKSSS